RPAASEPLHSFPTRRSSDLVVRFLLEHRMASKQSQAEDPIFVSRNGRPLNHRNVARRGFEPAAAEAGIEGVSFHDLRHATLRWRSEEHTSELQSPDHLVCRL